MHPRRGAARAAAGASLALMLVGLVVVTALHTLAPEVDPRVDSISSYARTEDGALMRGAYVAFGAAGALLGLALREHATDRWARAAAWSLAVGGAAIALLAWWWRGRPHDVTLGVAQTALFAGMLLLILPRRGVAEWRRVAIATWPLLGLVGSVAFNLGRLLPARGLMERVYFLALVLWCAAVAVNVLHVDALTARAEQPDTRRRPTTGQ